ncbi:hypothetical protein BJY04DRAFT_218132 [Aspergillus karnatakaensis]|uniref:uncharacterized protein n=1 Tax=Aspergillus karnatakaensis TaxID=1810916 RepID=UPI003CCD02BA
MHAVTIRTTRQSYTISGRSDSEDPPLKNESNVFLLAQTLALFQEIADCLASNELDRNQRVTYRYLHGNTLLFSERIDAIQNFGSSAALNPFANLILNRFARLVRPSSTSIPQHPAPTSTLVELLDRWSRLGSEQEKLEHLRSCLDLNTTDQWSKLVTFLEECLESLEEPTPQAVVLPRIQVKRAREPPTSLYVAARTMFQTLASFSRDCTCNTCHDYAARLKLATYRRPSQSEDKYSFDLHLSSGEPYWQETLIYTEPPQNNSKVRFTIPNELPKRKRQNRRALVRRLCEQIKPQPHAVPRCLNLGIEDGKLWKFQSSDSRLQNGSTLVALDRIIKNHPASLSEKIKRVLAVLLGHCLLHLHGMTWLQPSHFNSSNILFFGTPTLIPLSPFIQMKMEPDILSASLDGLDEVDDFTDPDDLPLHSHPELVMFAIMLMEIYLSRPISDLVLDNCPLYSIDENSRYRLATQVFQKHGMEFTDNYRAAIAKCLDPDIGFDLDDNEIEGDDLKSLIYKDIVQRLENELDQGFSESISSENLDEVAPQLNLNSWGTLDFSSIDRTTVLEKRTSPRSPSSISIPSTYSPYMRPFLGGSKSAETGLSAHRQVTETLHRSQSDYSLNTSRSFTHRSYTIGWICALAEEMAVARAMLDEIHPPLHQNYAVDSNNYILGCIGSHNVVLACLPDGVMGTTSAAIVAHRMRSTFQDIRFGLMVGIGGGVPSEIDDIRLGDVVVGVPRQRGSGVIQYDFGKTVQDGRLMLTSSLNRPPDALLTAVNSLRSEHLLQGHKIKHYLNQMLDQYPLLRKSLSYPGHQDDHLYQPNYYHPTTNRTCTACDQTKIIHRVARDSSEPTIHYGLIASGNQVMKDGLTRDRLKQELNILCFEMEAAGLVDDFPCLVIRGISDYADSHKNDMWRSYAAAAAAAYAKELLSSLSMDDAVSPLDANKQDECEYSNSTLDRVPQYVDGDGSVQFYVDGPAPASTQLSLGMFSSHFPSMIGSMNHRSVT